MPVVPGSILLDLPPGFFDICHACPYQNENGRRSFILDGNFRYFIIKLFIFDYIDSKGLLHSRSVCPNWLMGLESVIYFANLRKIRESGIP